VRTKEDRGCKLELKDGRVKAKGGRKKGDWGGETGDRSTLGLQEKKTKMTVSSKDPRQDLRKGSTGGGGKVQNVS